MRLGPLRHPWFAAFSGSVGLGGLGDEVARLALPLLILDLTHSIAAAATLRLVQALPYVFFGGIAGVLIDRADKRKLLIGCDVLSIALTLAIPLSVPAGVFSIDLVYVIGFLLGTVEVAWGVTTDFSVVPALVEPDELTSANAAYFGIDRAARVVGPTIGGLAIAALGTADAMYIAALAFVPTLVVFVLMPPIYDIDRPTAAITARNIASELAEGFRFVWHSRVLRWLLVLMFIANLGQQGVQTLVLYVLREENSLNEVTIGLAFSLAGAVTVLASFIAPRLASGRPLGHTLLGSTAAAGIIVALTALAHDWRLIVAGFAARETASTSFIIYAFVPRQREVPARIRGRANGAFRTLVLISNSFSAPFLSFVVAAAGSSAAFAVAGATAILAAAATYFTPLRSYNLNEPPASEEVEQAAK
ncbi:MAG TPA: MFS transporter [Candidatus Limnocylindria bacterium]|jgi:predicted MFS family arabinose efflux permease|nr:MFS transporter [Candidatus Limnocylindria bacterium]